MKRSNQKTLTYMYTLSINIELIKYRSCCFLQVHHTEVFCPPPFLTSSPCLSPPPYTFPHPYRHSAVKVVRDECSLETSQVLGTSRRLLYVCGFLVKLKISPVSRHVHYLRLYPSTLWWLAGIDTFFLTAIFPSDIKNQFHMIVFQ